MEIIENNISFKTPIDPKIKERYLKLLNKNYKELLKDDHVNPLPTPKWYYFIEINEFGDPGAMERATVDQTIDGRHLMIGNSTQSSLNEMCRYGTVSFQTVEERDKCLAWLLGFE